MKNTLGIPGSAGRSGVSDLCECLYGHGEGAGVIGAVGTALPLGILSGVMAGWESDPCGVFHKWRYPKNPQNHRFMMENPIQMDDLGYPHFRKTPCVITRGYLCIYSHMLRFLGARKIGIRVAPRFFWEMEIYETYHIAGCQSGIGQPQSLCEFEWKKRRSCNFCGKYGNHCQKSQNISPLGSST